MIMFSQQEPTKHNNVKALTSYKTLNHIIESLMNNLCYYVIQYALHSLTSVGNALRLWSQHLLTDKTKTEDMRVRFLCDAFFAAFMLFINGKLAAAGGGWLLPAYNNKNVWTVLKL